MRPSVGGSRHRSRITRSLERAATLAAPRAWRSRRRPEAAIGRTFAVTPDLTAQYNLPTDDWTFNANYFPLVNFNATARRRLADGLSLIAFYRSDTEIYFLAERQQDDQRFYVFDQRAAAGVERTLGRGFALEATASYIFDRQLF